MWWTTVAGCGEAGKALHAADKGTKSDFSRNMQRTPLYKVEALFLGARLGYRDRYLRALAIGVGAT